VAFADSVDPVANMLPNGVATAGGRAAVLDASRSRMAPSTAAGLRCMYRCVVFKSSCPARSWIALAGAPRIARCEQNVC